MQDRIKLTKDGIFGEKWSNKARDRIVSGHRAGGHRKGEFFFLNHRVPIEIKGRVTLLDLIKIMSKMNADELHALSTISDANIAPYLIDFAENPDPIPDDDDGSKLDAIEVYKIVELSNWDSCGDVWTLQINTSAHGVGEIWKQAQDDVEAGLISKKDAEKCNTYAIEFTQWQKMLHLPIRISEFVHYGEVVWKKTKPHKMMVGVIGRKKKESLGTIDRTIDRDATDGRDKKVKAEMTLAEFFTGLFDELCFFGSPAKRSEQEDILSERIKDVEKYTKKKK